jgi:hypothetical protein
LRRSIMMAVEMITKPFAVEALAIRIREMIER